MDIKAYISSGILESYAMGMATPEERREVECLSTIYPEIKTELQQIEVGIEAFSFKTAIKVPEGLKGSILDAISDEEQLSDESVEQPVSAPAEEKTQKTDQAAIGEGAIKRSVNNWKWFAAAACLAFVFSTSLYLLNINKVVSYATKIDDLEKENLALNGSVDELKKERALIQSNNELLAAKTTQKVILKGTPGHAQSETIAYWNSADQKVLLVANNLPEIPSDKDFQLWAIVAGAPVDLGVLELTDASILRTLKSTEAPQAFAITIEDKGGHPTPNLEALVVIGNI